MHPYDNAEALLRVLREPRRNHFFYGKRMDVQHFRMEQDHGKLKQWLLNRLALGKGVLCGLRVSVDGGKVCVDPGVAIDGLGREIIVPIRCCLDPIVVDEGCCAAHAARAPATAPAPEPGTPARPPDAGTADGPGQPRLVDGLFTLWLCYRECLTDHQLLLVSECGSRDECSPGTVVETFCLKFLPGLAPPQGDPDWCAKLWGPRHDPPPAPPAPAAPAPAPAPMHTHGELPPLNGLGDADRARAQAAMDSRRQLLCELFDGDCTAADGDPCVPLALVVVREGRLAVETCLVRPRIYSNERLLDLILCLADRLDECCGEHRPPPPAAPPLQVRSIDFIRHTAAGESVVRAMADPLQVTQVDINGKTDAIRIRFTRALATGGGHGPATHGYGDADFARRNVQVLPDEPLGGLPYVPGELTAEQPDTIRFDLLRDSPYARGADGWQKGRYRIVLIGDDAAAQGRLALADRDNGSPLDGEPIAPAGGVLSGKNGPGGDFGAPFVVGGRTPAPPPPPEHLMHVRAIEFLGVQRQVIGRLDTPEQPARLREHLAAVRIAFDQPYLPAGDHAPSVAARNDPKPERANIQLRLPRELQERFGTAYIAGKLTQEDPRTVLIEVERGTRLVNADGRWPTNLRIHCDLFIRGDADAANGLAQLQDKNGQALDGEARAPADGVMSGNGAPGGDFKAAFDLLIPG